MKKLNDNEQFDNDQIIKAIEQWLEYGNKQYLKSQQGYFSGFGWAARALRFHLKQLKEK